MASYGSTDMVSLPESASPVGSPVRTSTVPAAPSTAEMSTVSMSPGPASTSPAAAATSPPPVSESYLEVCPSLVMSDPTGWLIGHIDAIREGCALSYLSSQPGENLVDSEREHCDAILPLTCFENSWEQNRTLIHSPSDPENGQLIYILTKAVYSARGILPEHITPDRIAGVEYQRACQPGVVRIWDDAATLAAAAHPDGSRTFRMTKQIVRFIYSVTMQLRCSTLSPEQLAALAPVCCDGRVPQRGLLLERTKRDIFKLDSTRTVKSVLLYYWPSPGEPAIVNNITVVATTTIPRVVAGLLKSFSSMAGREVAETAVRTRRFFASDPFGGATYCRATPVLYTPCSPPGRARADSFRSADSLVSFQSCAQGDVEPQVVQQDQQNFLHHLMHESGERTRVVAAGGGTAIALVSVVVAVAGGPAMVAAGAAAAAVGGGIAGANYIRSSLLRRHLYPRVCEEWQEGGVLLRYDHDNGLRDALSDNPVTHLDWQQSSDGSGTLVVTTRSTTTLRCPPARLQQLAALAEAGGVRHSLPPPRSAVEPRTADREHFCTWCCVQ